MRHLITVACALLANSLALPALAQAPAAASDSSTPASYAQAKARADQDEASLPKDVATAMRITQADTLEQGVKSCATPNPDTSPFVIVTRLDARGMIDQTWRQGSTPLSICMEKFLRGRMLMVPLRAPFYVSYELSFET